MNMIIGIRKIFFCGIFYALLALTAHAQVSSLPNGFPSNDASNGAVVTKSQGLSSLGAPPADGTVFNVHIRLPKTATTLEIEIFDPELYSNTASPLGFWDFPALNFTPGLAAYADATRFELYPDVDIAGNTTTGMIASLLADSTMDSQWIDFFNGATIANDPTNAAACEPDPGKFCYYHLVARWVDPVTNIPKSNATTFGGNVLNGFLVASNGVPFLPKGSTIGIIGMTEDSPAFPVPPTNYDGTLSLRALVASTQECALDIYDGDSDRAGTATAADYPDESDDPNTPNDGIATGFFPFSLSGDTVEEGIRPGNPADNSKNRPDRSIGTPVFYTVDPEPPTADYGVDCCVNDNPSGDREWELYRIASSAPGCPDVTDPNYDPDGAGSAPAAAPDVVVDQIGPGFHKITFSGMDPNNQNFLNASADLFTGDAFDFGDAPDSYGTTLVNNAAFHDVDARLTLGVEIDAEFDGDPTTAADGDDTSLVDDEDGVNEFDPLITNMAGENYTVEVAVRNELDPGDSATLFGWIDFNLNGTFETGESASVPVNPQMPVTGNPELVNLVFTIPADITAGDTYARFRLTSDTSINTTTPGGGATDGEVEDYTLVILPDEDECIPCKGMQKLTLEMSGWDNSGTVQRDPNEIVRVRVGDLGGRFSGSDFNAPVLFEGQVPNGGTIDVTVPFQHLGKTLTISVEGRSHAVEFGKAIFHPDCELKLHTRSGNNYIEFKVVAFEKNSDQICKPVGGQGCTPGYWKQPHHFDSWVSYQPGDIFKNVFTRGNRQTLLFNLSKGGGGGIAFRRHAVAALLNAANPSVNYFKTVDQVIDTVKATYSLVWKAPQNQQKAIWNAAKDVFEQQNELGCPLN